MNKKISTPVAIVIILACAILVAGLAFWQYFEMPKGEIPEFKPAEEIQPAAETADWKSYRNEEYGFEIKYPKDWRIKETDESFGKQFFLDKAEDHRENYRSYIYIYPEGRATGMPHVIRAERKNTYFADREASEHLFFTEEGDLWVKYIFITSNIPKNWSKDNYIIANIAIDNIELKCGIESLPIDECGLEMGVRAFGSVDREEDQVIKKILSTFRFLERI